MGVDLEMKNKLMKLPTTFGDPKRAHVTHWQPSEGGPFEGLQSLPVGDMGRAPSKIVLRPMLRWQVCGGLRGDLLPGKNLAFIQVSQP